eukprot:jgi/Chlat1/6244/Chrsp44S05849
MAATVAASACLLQQRPAVIGLRRCERRKEDRACGRGGVRVHAAVRCSAPGASSSSDHHQHDCTPTSSIARNAATAGISLAAALLLTCCSPTAAWAEGASSTPAASFTRSCAGCHAAGGNIVQAGKSLRIGDMQRNGMTTVDDVYKIIYAGKGKMPGYGTECKPRGQCTFGPRLSDEDITALANYVIENANSGWTQ